MIGDGGTAGRGAGLPGAAGTVAWRRKGTGNSQGLGSFRILPDGSRVIGWGQDGTKLVFTEVDLDGNDLVDFYYNDDDYSYRAIKLPLEALDLSAMRATAGTLSTAP